MKDTFVRTKERAEETQNPHHNSSADYASSNIQGTAQGAVRKTVQHFSNPRKKVHENLDRAKGHFQEVKRQMPKERQRTTEQAHQTAQKAKSNAEQLRKTADQAADSAQEAKKAVRDAKQTLHEVRQAGRQTLREMKQNAGVEQGVKTGNTPAVGTPKSEMPRFHSGASDIAPGSGGNLPSSQFPPNYLSKGINVPQSTGEAAKSLEKSAKTVKSTTKGFKETSKGTIKTAKKSVKTAEKSSKAAVKTAQQTAKTAQKTAQAAAKSAKVAEKAARFAAKTAVQAAKAATKAVIAMVKVAIAAIKGLVALIAAGGWVAVTVILIICLIGLLVGSVFGIFFSSEPDPSTGKTVNGIIAEIDAEYTGKIDNIISSNTHDLLDMSGARAAWKQVLAVYTVKTVTAQDNPMEVATMNGEKAPILQTVFWDMNTISHEVATTTVYEDVLDDNGLPTGETTPVSKTVQRITVTHKTTDEMAVKYGFNNEQKTWLEELLKPEYHGLWNGLLYGITSIGDGSLIEIADTQIGNIGGEPYWRWYGFNSHVAWCACFVSWCADQCGYIDAGVIPRFSFCDDGIQWFKNRGQWQDNSYMPAPGDIIFFDWDGDGNSDHVGIVERAEGDNVHTIEGNTNDSCARRSYRLDSSQIQGYGIPLY